MFSTAEKNAALDAIATFYVGAHDDYPGDDGSHELSGGAPAYARKQVNPGAAAAGARISAETPSLDIPAGTLSWLSVWSAAAAGTYRGCFPQGGMRKRFFADPVTDEIFSPAHGFADGTKIVFFGSGLAPGGLTAGTIYFVVSATTDTFKVATTLGGPAIDINAGSGAQVWVSRIIPLTYGSQSTYDLTGFIADLND